MTKSYRIDWADAKDRTYAVYDLSRKEAMLQAATKSRSVGTAYAIAHEDDEDIGQRVYERGRFCYQEGAY